MKNVKPHIKEMKILWYHYTHIRLIKSKGIILPNIGEDVGKQNGLYIIVITSDTNLVLPGEV